ncbi:MAG TPA: hypothetical protein VFU13_07605 [Steroidobacteraceae bacterium]|nr:hypothetical protein [Steroidobacteraceae bacterium]
MERHIRRALAVFAIACAFSGLTAQAADDIGLSRNWKVCATDTFELPKDIFTEWVPVGCEIVDCCPGCPGILDRLSWRIKVEGAPLESATLKFSRLPRDVAAGLKFEGTAQGSAENLLIGKGEASISGLPVELAGRAPVAQLDVGLDQAWLQGQAKQSQAFMLANLEDAGDSGSITIEQYYDKYRVNEYKIAFRFPRCFFPLRDRIVLSNNASGDAAAVLVDARRSTGCVFEEERRGAGIIGMGSVLSNGGCRSEVAVFSDDDAMKFVPGVAAWTDFLGDTLNVNLTPDRLMAPLHVWLARPGSFITALGDVNNANLLYNTNNSGIGFAPVFHFVSGNPLAVATIGTGCASAPAVIGSAFFVAGQLNAYYVNDAFTGVNCGVDRNVQYVGTTANNQTLAHEFGHSMSLSHTNGDPAFPVTNVMIGGGAARTHFADGQSFRMNAHCSSTLNSNGVRTGPVRRCPNTISGNVTCSIFTDTHCPPLAADVLPK